MEKADILAIVSMTNVLKASQYESSVANNLRTFHTAWIATGHKSNQANMKTAAMHELTVFVLFICLGM